MYEGKDGAIEDIITGKRYFLITAHGVPAGSPIPAPCGFAASCLGFTVLPLSLIRSRIIQRLSASVCSAFTEACVLPVKEPQLTLKNLFTSQYHWNPIDFPRALSPDGFPLSSVCHHALFSPLWPLLPTCLITKCYGKTQSAVRTVCQYRFLQRAL